MPRQQGRWVPYLLVLPRRGVAAYGQGDVILAAGGAGAWGLPGNGGEEGACLIAAGTTADAVDSGFSSCAKNTSFCQGRLSVRGHLKITNYKLRRVTLILSSYTSAHTGCPLSALCSSLFFLSFLSPSPFKGKLSSRTF